MRGAAFARALLHSYLTGTPWSKPVFEQACDTHKKCVTALRKLVLNLSVKLPSAPVVLSWERPLAGGGAAMEVQEEEEDAAGGIVLTDDDADEEDGPLRVDL